MDLDFDKLFQPSLNAMKINGSYPYIKRDWKWFKKFLVMQGLYEILHVLLIYNLITDGIQNRDLARISTHGTISLIITVITCMYGVLLGFQDTFRDLMELMKADYEHAKTLPAEEMNVVIEYARKGEFITIWWQRVVVAAGAVIILQAILLTMYSGFKDEFQVVDFHPLHLPKFEYNTARRYIIANFIYCFGMVYTCVMYVALVPLGPVFMLHACGQLAVLKIRVKTLFPDQGFSPEATINKLRDIAKGLREIYEFVEKIQKAFKGLYDVTLKGTSYLLPLLGCSMIQAVRNMVVPPENPALIFVAAVLFSSFPCYFSDKLLEQSNSFKDELYNCGWEKYYNRPSRITLLVILTRCSKPMVIRTMFRIVCLDTLASVFKEAYTIFNLLLTMI